jgi:hypothetical protein
MMNRQAFDDVINAFKRRVPFRPFVIERDEGEPLVVNRPDQVRCFYGSGEYIYPNGDVYFLLHCDNVNRVVELPETLAEVIPPAGA